jgi:hypothetical protein
MDAVYNLAFLTIVAAAGDDANAGCVLSTFLDFITPAHSMAFTWSLLRVLKSLQKLLGNQNGPLVGGLFKSMYYQ